MLSASKTHGANHCDGWHFLWQRITCLHVFLQIRLSQKKPGFTSTDSTRCLVTGIMIRMTAEFEKFSQQRNDLYSINKDLKHHFTDPCVKENIYLVPFTKREQSTFQYSIHSNHYDPHDYRHRVA